MEHLKELTEQVCRLARETGAYLKAERRNFRPEVAEEKHEHDYVSYVDREAERRIVGALHELLPEAGFVTEEGTAGLKGEELRWVVDPLPAQPCALLREHRLVQTLGEADGGGVRPLQGGVLLRLEGGRCLDGG